LVTAPTFACSLPLFFLKSVVDVWFLTGVDRWVWDIRDLYIDMRVKGSMKMIIYKLIYVPANDHESLLNLKGVYGLNLTTDGDLFN
jgi:hypothetical protein